MILIQITLCVALFIAEYKLEALSLPCNPKLYGNEKLVCICNSTYCDTIEIPDRLKSTHFLTYTSSKSGSRFCETLHPVTSQENDVGEETIDIIVYRDVKFQSIIGFGGALTDAAAINYQSISQGTRANFIDAYYSPAVGINYNMVRLPIASSDFSTRIYSYNDVEGDYDMTNFKLVPEDIDLRIPMLKDIHAVTDPKPGGLRKISVDNGPVLKVIACPWSAPAWLKTNRSMIGGTLIHDPLHYKAWAKYFVKFVTSYLDYEIPIWALSVQNEPEDGYNSRHQFQSMLYHAEEVYDFAVNYLCPALKAELEKRKAPWNITLMVLDDNRPFLRRWAHTILPRLNGSTACISGLAVHWYLNFLSPASIQTSVHNDFPQYYILPSESSAGSLPWKNNVALGDWERGEQYAKDIMNNLLNWASGYVDWNLGLNEGGGPNWIKNFVDSAIIFNATADEFYKQPIFYTIGHFSKFLGPGAVRIDLKIKDSSNSLFKAVAFESEKRTTVIIINLSDMNVTYRLEDLSYGNLVDTSEQHSIKTIIWPRDKGIRKNSILKIK